MGPLAPTIHVLWETAEKSMAAKLRTVRSCKTLGQIYNKRKSVLYFQSNGKVKRKWPIGGWLWILFWLIRLKVKDIVCVIIVAWNSVVNHPLATSCEILVASAKLLVALAIRKGNFGPCEPVTIFGERLGTKYFVPIFCNSFNEGLHVQSFTFTRWQTQYTCLKINIKSYLQTFSHIYSQIVYNRTVLGIVEYHCFGLGIWTPFSPGMEHQPLKVQNL